MKRAALYVALFIVSFGTVGCTREDSAERTLRQNGFTEIELTGYSVFSCSEDDTFRTGFRAKAVNGEIIEGTVCEGLLKGKTIRLD